MRITFVDLRSFIGHRVECLSADPGVAMDEEAPVLDPSLSPAAPPTAPAETPTGRQDTVTSALPLTSRAGAGRAEGPTEVGYTGGPVAALPDQGSSARPPATAMEADADEDSSTESIDAGQSSSSHRPADMDDSEHVPSVLIDYRTLSTLCAQLLQACPVAPAFFAPQTRYSCKRIGYACFTRRGLCRFAVDAFCFRHGDPEPPSSLVLFRKMIPHTAGVFWDTCWHKNASEEYSFCAEHCQDAMKQSGSTHVFVD